MRLVGAPVIINGFNPAVIGCPGPRRVNTHTLCPFR
jgi:hypothetical protein